MKNHRSHLARMIHQFSNGDGLHESPVPGVHCLKLTRQTERAKNRWRAGLGVIAQGSKEIILGRKVYRCDAVHYTMAPIVLPVISRIDSASLDKPFLGLLIDLEPFGLSELISQLDSGAADKSHARACALLTGKANDKMLDATVRLVSLFQTPDDARVLGPLVVREIYYHLLKSREGTPILQFLRAGTQTHRMSQAIHAMRSELFEDIDVSVLAKATHMSRSAFFKCFKELTLMSPIQYQKKLRLLEARRLMVEEAETAERAARMVGYKSASQFSREYSRMFGNSPLRDTMKIRKPG